MSARPEGTDGSDHEFREKVAEAYKVLAQHKKWAHIGLSAWIIPMVLRTVWFSWVASVAGLNVSFPAMAIMAIFILGRLFWSLAKIGSAKESLTLTKISSSLCALCVAMLFVNSFKYHFMIDPQLHVGFRLVYVRGISGVLAVILAKMDACLDSIAFLIGCFVFSNIHPYITIQMALKKKQDQLAKAAGAAKAAQESKAIKASPMGKKDAEGSVGPVRRSSRRHA